MEASGSHNDLVLETRKEEVENVVLINEDKNEEDLISYKEIKKLHEVNNYKKRSSCFMLTIMMD